MAYRLLSHHRSFFSPHYFPGTAGCLTANSIRRLVFDVTSQADFDKEVLQSEKPIVVDFHAGWCGPCKVIGPRLTAVISKFEGQVDLAKVDVDDMQDLAMEYGLCTYARIRSYLHSMRVSTVLSVPTVLGMKRGNVIEKFVGVKEQAEIEQFVQKILDSE